MNTTIDIFQFVARNADIADAHQFSREHKSAINSALSRAGLPTLGGRKTQTMGHLRTLVHGAEVVAARPERIAHEPVTPEREKQDCLGVNLSASSAHADCSRKQEEAWCWQHKGQRGRTRKDLLAERAQNIAQAERERKEYLARKEAREVIAEFATV